MSNSRFWRSISEQIRPSQGDQIRRLCHETQYLNNSVEQDHRAIKKITRAMMGFKSFCSAKATLAGIELHHMLRKGQHENSTNMTVFEQFYALAA